MSGLTLIRRLRREIKASPKKAAALAVLLLVAMYYWMPLLKGIVARGDSASSPAPVHQDELPDAEFARMATGMATAPAKAPPGEAKPSYGWEQVDQWLKDDPMTGPAQDLIRRRNPFQPAQAKVVQIEPEPQEETPVETVPTPDSLGMALSGIVLGPGRRVAVIDGRAYSEGQNVFAKTTTKTNTSTTPDGRGIQFRLAEVRPQGIVLERAGQRFELALPPRTPSVGIESAGF